MYLGIIVAILYVTLAITVKALYARVIESARNIAKDDRGGMRALRLKYSNYIRLGIPIRNTKSFAIKVLNESSKYLVWGDRLCSVLSIFTIGIFGVAGTFIVMKYGFRDILIDLFGDTYEGRTMVSFLIMWGIYGSYLICIERKNCIEKAVEMVSDYLDNTLYYKCGDAKNVDVKKQEFVVKVESEEENDDGNEYETKESTKNEDCNQKIFSLKDALTSKNAEEIINEVLKEYLV